MRDDEAAGVLIWGIVGFVASVVIVVGYLLWH